MEAVAAQVNREQFWEPQTQIRSYKKFGGLWYPVGPLSLLPLNPPVDVVPKQNAR